MKEKIVALLQEINPDIKENINLIDDGVIDSFSVVNIVAELESCFQIEIESEDIIGENFETVDQIVSLVEKYTRK